MKIVFKFHGNVDAQSVKVTGSWLEWNKRVALRKAGDGSWKSEEIDVPSGRIEYKFIVDDVSWVLADDQPKCISSIDGGAKIENNWTVLSNEEEEEKKEKKQNDDNNNEDVAPRDIVRLICDAVSNLFFSSSSSSSSSTTVSLAVPSAHSDSVVNAVVTATATAVAAAVEKEEQEAEAREFPDNEDIVDGNVEIAKENVDDDGEKEKREKEQEEEGELENTERAVIPYQSARLHPFPDYLGYKIVHFCRRKDGSGEVSGVWALLHLQIPQRPSTKMFFSEIQGKRVEVFPPRDGMRDKTKYCTTHAQVIGVQFFGNAVDVKYALLNFQSNRGHLVSGFGGGNRMQYKLGRMHFEPRAGNPGSHCSYGIHFFRDPQSGFDYGGFNNPKKYYAPVVAKVLTKSRGFVADMEDELFQRQTFSTAASASTTSASSANGAIEFSAKALTNNVSQTEKKGLSIISLVRNAQEKKKNENSNQ